MIYEMSNLPDCLPPHSASALMTFSVKDLTFSVEDFIITREGDIGWGFIFNEISELS